eukprot:1334924-Amorphochlora_amoeboformis.AAC.1
MKNHVVSRGLMVIGHSMGNNIFRYFEKWIKYSMGVTAGKEWLATYINTFIAVGAPILGAQFSLQAVLGDGGDCMMLRARCGWHDGDCMLARWAWHEGDCMMLRAR